MAKLLFFFLMGGITILRSCKIIKILIAFFDGVLFNFLLCLPESQTICSSNTLASDCDIDCMLRLVEKLIGPCTPVHQRTGIYQVLNCEVG